jgi:uncharacterized protein involved in response to NO
VGLPLVEPAAPEPRRASVFLGRGFRPFFLLAGIAAVVAMGAWLGLLRGFGAAPKWGTPIQWHAHEMLFGFAGAAIAGFLLTSVPVWTGRPAVAGRRLAGIALLWLAGRFAVFFAAALPSPWIAATLDPAFFAAIALAIGVPLVASGSRRNYGFPLLLLLLALANGFTHLWAMGVWGSGAATGFRLGVGVVIVLIATLGGRLVPLFTGAALKRAGVAASISSSKRADAAAVPLLCGFVLADTVWPDTPLSGVVAALAAATLAWRAKGWELRRALGDPLLWSMHLAYLWLPLGLAAHAAAAFDLGIARNVAVHALTVGAVGGMILAIMTRVALGHTGRPFVAPNGVAAAYALVHLAALARTAGLALAPEAASGLFLASGGLWVLAFAIFLAVYTPILIAPRVDGRPG